MDAPMTRPQAAARTQERKAANLKAWGVSLAVHAVLFCLLAATGFFLLVREQPETQDEDVVDITMLESSGGGGGGAPQPASAPPPAAAAAAPVVTLPTGTKLPEIAETYTKEPEKQQEYRQEHHAETPAAPGAASAPSSTPAASGAGAGNAGASAGAGEGSGATAGSGSGAGSGNGAGSGPDTGSAPPEPPAPVDAGAYCTYRAVPSYPQSMIQSGAEGSVTVLITVSPDSAVTSVEVVGSSGYPALDQAAVAAGWACRFSMNGHPGRYRTTYRFQLQDSGDDW